MERVNIDKVFHPFITGAYNKLVGEMMQETGARINVPPPSVNKTEIVITGEKEQVALAVAMIKKVAEEKVCLFFFFFLPRKKKFCFDARKKNVETSKVLMLDFSFLLTLVEC